jgi:lipopolysaccharide export system protein LptC
MTARGPLWLPLAILLLLAALSSWIERAVRAPTGTDAAASIEPEGIMENFHALRTTPDGRPQYRLSAQTLKHYSGSKRSEMEAPRFAQLDPSAGDVQAEAMHATVSPDGDEIDLRGKVVIIRAARAGQAAMTLRTEHLLVYPQRDLLHAPGAVSLDDGTVAARAGTMKYDAKRRVVELSGRVKARFQPVTR